MAPAEICTPERRELVRLLRPEEMKQGACGGLDDETAKGGKCVRVRQSPGVCTAFQAQRTLLCPCQASRRDQTLSEWLRRPEEVMEGETDENKELVTSFRAVVLEGVHGISPRPPSFLSVSKRNLLKLPYRILFANSK